MDNGNIKSYVNYNQILDLISKAKVSKNLSLSDISSNSYLEILMKYIEKELPDLQQMKISDFKVQNFNIPNLSDLKLIDIKNSDIKNVKIPENLSQNCKIFYNDKQIPPPPSYFQDKVKNEKSDSKSITR